MGSNKFWKIYNDIVHTININKYKYKVVIIDVMLYIYKNVIGSRGSSFEKNHIDALYVVLKYFLKKNIIPVCMFDGYSPEEKYNCVKRRRVDIETAIDEIDKIVLSDDNYKNSNKYIKNYKKTFILDTEKIDECKKMLELSGLPYFVAESETDKDSVYILLKYNNIFSAIVSDDSDTVLYGGSYVINKIDFKTDICKEINYNNTLKYFQYKIQMICLLYNIPVINITDRDLINFSIIMGNDYCHGVHTNQSNKIEKLLHLFVLSNLDIVTFINNLYKLNNALDYKVYQIPDNFIEKWDGALNLYTSFNIDRNIKYINETENYNELFIFLKSHMISSYIRDNLINDFINLLKSNSNLINNFKSSFIFY
jgi:5'-3' exonuclease